MNAHGYKKFTVVVREEAEKETDSCYDKYNYLFMEKRAKQFYVLTKNRYQEKAIFKS